MSDLHAGLADIFEIDPEELNSGTLLEDVSWDSLAIVSTIALFDELYGREVGIEDLKACRTIGDLEVLATA